MIFFVFLAAASFALALPAQAQEAPPALSTSSVVPSYVALATTLHDYTRFADGGPDANWYIGFNNAWIVKLPPAPAGRFQRAFIGAKIGRAKTRPDPERPWVREKIPGQIYIGLSQTPAWSAERSFFLAETADVPAEADPQAGVDGVGAAEWFWAEVPMSLVSFTEPNYLIVWSPTSYFLNASSAPILAAADAGESAASEETLAWNNRSILGVPPRAAMAALETPIGRILPALAIKLSPAAPEPSVGDLTVARAERGLVARFSASGRDISEAWVEASRDGLDWSRVSREQRRPPYLFSLPPSTALGPGSWVRGAARAASGTIGYSEPYRIPYEPRPRP